MDLSRVMFLLLVVSCTLPNERRFVMVASSLSSPRTYTNSASAYNYWDPEDREYKKKKRNPRTGPNVNHHEIHVKDDKEESKDASSAKDSATLIQFLKITQAGIKLEQINSELKARKRRKERMAQMQGKLRSQKNTFVSDYIEMLNTGNINGFRKPEDEPGSKLSDSAYGYDVNVVNDGFPGVNEMNGYGDYDMDSRYYSDDNVDPYDNHDPNMMDYSYGYMDDVDPAYENDLGNEVKNEEEDNMISDEVGEEEDTVIDVVSITDDEQEKGEDKVTDVTDVTSAHPHLSDSWNVTAQGRDESEEYTESNLEEFYEEESSYGYDAIMRQAEEHLEQLSNQLLYLENSIQTNEQYYGYGNTMYGDYYDDPASMQQDWYNMGGMGLSKEDLMVQIDGMIQQISAELRARKRRDKQSRTLEQMRAKLRAQREGP